MNPHDSEHLTADELDAFLTESSSNLAMSHLATCPECAAMVANDRRLVAALSALPRFEVTSGFPDRIMAQVALPTAPVLAVAREVETARSVAARRRAFGAVLLAGGGIAAGFVWANAHPADALRWSAPAVQSAGHTLWLSLQTIVANATEQPWFSSVRDTLANPLQAFAVTAGAAGVYAIGLVGLRRLMNEPTTNASW